MGPGFRRDADLGSPRSPRSERIPGRLRSRERALAKLLGRVVGGGLLVVLLCLSQQPGLEVGGCRVLGQGPQMRSLARMVVGDIPRQRLKALVAHFGPPLLLHDSGKPRGAPIPAG